MVKKESTPQSELALVGGRVCLDFINSTDRRPGAKDGEGLTGYGNLVHWSRRAWILGPMEERALLVDQRLRPDVAARVYRRALESREALHRLFSSILDGAPPAPADLDRVNRWIAEGAAHRRLESTARGLRWRWASQATDLDRMLWPVAQSAAELLASDDVRKLKRCGECGWMFLDGSKNFSRRWCKKGCGDRVKARRYYRRLQGEAV
jgi:predicted RNA-binding Zn ribbon-like protein